MREPPSQRKKQPAFARSARSCAATGHRLRRSAARCGRHVHSGARRDPTCMQHGIRDRILPAFRSVRGGLRVCALALPCRPHPESAGRQYLQSRKVPSSSLAAACSRVLVGARAFLCERVGTTAARRGVGFGDVGVHSAHLLPRTRRRCVRWDGRQPGAGRAGGRAGPDASLSQLS